MNRTSTLAAGVLAAATVLALPAGADPMDTMKKAGCTACHAPDKKLIGPSFQDIAAKYRDQDKAGELAQKVRTGGKGNWGPIPMPPHTPAQIDDEALAASIRYILTEH